MLRRSRTPAPSTTGVGVTISAMVRSVLMAEVLRPPCAAARPHPWPCLGGSALLAREPLRRERDAVADAEREDVPVDERLERAVVEADEDVVDALDRKSTRLNSSHGSISYAVFCLKKK